LKNAKEVWDVLKTAHEGEEVTKITKRETIEGELGRFVLNKGEEPQVMYNRLNTMVNQARNLGSTKWDDHEMVKVILRSLVFRNPTQVQLICENPRYKQMSPEEVIGKFVSFELMVKDSNHIANLEQGVTSTPKVQPIAFKTMDEKEEPMPTTRLPIDASKFDNDEMALIIKSFKQILKQRKGQEYKHHSKRVCYRCGKSGHYIAKCLYASESDRDDDKKGKKKMEKKKYYNKKKGDEAHIGREWDSDESSTDSSSDEDAANIAINKGLLFPNVGHKCLMAKKIKKKVYSRDTLKYTTSDDESSSSEKNDDLSSPNILECQEYLLVKENKKIVKLKNAFALEVEKCKVVTEELKTSNDLISCLKTEKASLIAKIEELNACHVLTSTIEHVTICTRCRDVDVNAMNDHLAMIKEQNDHIAKLNAKLPSMSLKMKILNLLIVCFTMGDTLSLRMELASNLGAKTTSNLMPIETRFSTLLRARLAWCKIEKVIFYILKTILSIRVEEFMLRNIFLLLIMLIFTVMRLLVLGIQLILRCLRKRLFMHQMNIAFHLRPLMHPLFLLTNPTK
jgi:hypothetical protein